jgi:hypothetical protein
MERYKIAEAAEKWIGMVEADQTATAEQKTDLIAKIRLAVPKASFGPTVGYPDGMPKHLPNIYAECRNAICRAMRGALNS